MNKIKFKMNQNLIPKNIIGILSMHRVVNYGSFLQAFALKKLIEKKGYNVEFIDIKNRVSFFYIFYFFKNLRYKLALFLLNNAQFRFTMKKSFKFRKIFHTLLGLKNKFNYNLTYNKVIIGSDEVFNVKQYSPWRYNLQLFGKGFSGKVYSYAASFGSTTKKFIDKFSLRNQIIKYLSDFKYISVRDKNSELIIKYFCNKVPSINLDPTLIYNFKANIKPIEYKEKFILVYSYDGRIKVNKQIQELIDFAHINNYKLIGVGSYNTFCDENLIPDPFELLSYFKKASYILTDTFHGTIFSIIYHKSFATIIRNSNENKLSDLLNKFKLTSRQCRANSSIVDIFNKDYDYDYVQKTIEFNRIKTENYLNKILSINKK